MTTLDDLFAVGERRLLPDQNEALLKIGRNQGGFLQLLPGTGKTDICALAPWMIVECERPLVLMPGGLLEEFRTKLPKLRANWRLHPNCVWESYDRIAHPDGITLLAKLAPGVIICDEARRLGKVGTTDDRKTSASAGRILGYVEQHNIPLVACDGSFYTQSATRYLHTAHFATRNSPQGPVVPKTRIAHEAIAAGVDARGSTHAARKLSKLLGAKCETPEDAREALKNKLLSHDAVMISSERFGGAALEIRVQRVRPCEAIREVFDRLRTYEELPDGWSLGEGLGEVAQAARQLAWGYYYVWEPRPSDSYFAARLAWNRRVNKMIRAGRCDTEGTAIRALKSGEYEDFDTWKAEKQAYVGVQKAVWLPIPYNQSPLQDAIDWGAAATRGLIWTGDFLALGHELSRTTGWRFYAEGGLDVVRGTPIQKHESKWGPAIVSTASNYQGRDMLQYLFDEQLILDPPASGARWDQLLARLLRYGRTAPVKTTVLLACKENLQALHSAIASAKAIESQLSPQLLLGCDLQLPPLRGYGSGPVWD